jgi:hypothetical protein
VADSQEKPEQKNSKDEVALELMKFITVTTGYGKGESKTGFNAAKARTPEEYADALLDLYKRCRAVVNEA